MSQFLKIIIPLWISVLCFPSLSAQNQAIGVINDNAGKPLAYANIMLYSAVDSSFVKGEVADENGRFEFLNLSPGSFYCQVSMVGLSPKEIPVFEIREQSGKLDFGTIVLGESIDLAEVVVTGSKAMIEVRPDRIVFNVANSPTASGNNGLELLSKAPGVSVDMDNNIQLLGKTGVQIYINGKPSRLSGDDLAMMLKNMNSDNIESVEIISNPSSKYEAEGDAGIIDIKLKRNVAMGVNGNFTSSFSQGNYLRYNNSLAVNYGGEKVNAYIGISRSDQDIQDNFLDVKKQNGNTQHLNSEEISMGESYNISAGMNVVLNENHDLGFSGNGILNNNDNRLLSTTGISYPETSGLDRVLVSQTLLDQTSENYNLNANYTWDMEEAGILSSSLSGGKFRKEGSTFQPNTFYQPDEVSVISTSDHAFETDTDIDLFSAKLDYEKTWGKFTLSGGGKYSHIFTDNRFDFFTVEQSEQVPDPTRSNDFNYKEEVMAAYVVMEAGLGQYTMFSAGLRVENTASRGLLTSALNIDNTDVERRYTDLFPNLGISYNDNKTHAINISIGRRLSRPNYQNLNPFESPLSELTAWKGNPFLNPSYTMNYQLTYALMQKLTITNRYSVTQDFVGTLMEISGENSNIFTPRNIDRSSSYGISISYPLEVTDYWEFVTYLNGAYDTYKGGIGRADIDLTAMTWNIRIQNNLKLPWGLFMDITYRRYSDWIWRGSIRVEGNHSLDFGIRKNFFNDRLQIRLTGADVLRTNSDYYYEGNYGGIMIDGVRSFDIHRFGAGVSWKFGNQKVKSVKKSKGAMDDELERLQGSE